jgi:hypothetical protein
MRFDKIISLIFMGIFLISFASATCTVTLDKTEYVQTETVTAAIVCDEPQEKSLSYALNWTNSSGALVHQDNGTTPATKGELFYEDYVLPADYLGAINATLSGDGLTAAEDTANVTALAAGGNENILVITNSSFGGGYIGSVGSITAMVKDENGKKISGGRCMISGWSNDESQMILSKETFIVDGDVKVDAIMSTERFAEGTQYAYKILCYCGSAVSGTECIDEDGANINNSVGNTKGSFETKTWLTVNTVVDKSVYEMKKEIFICANITNVDYTKRIHIPIRYESRCSAGTDNNQDTDRILIIYDYVLDERGINANTTQMQCKKFIIPEERYLMGRDSECYASTEVIVLNEANEEVISYHTSSSVFNISSDEINLKPDWQWISNTRLNSIFNLSDSAFEDYNGTGVGNIDLQLHSNFNELDIAHALELFNSIANVTVKNLTSTLTRHIDYELEFTEEDHVEIELRNVDLSKSSGVGWWNITIDFYNLDLRQTEALEGVENKTGTFHLAVDCPSVVDVGSNMNCSISAQVEDSQVVEKEVDFTCYISDGVNEFSSLNYNQMINRSLITLYREFLVPSSFASGSQYILQCHADYYNFGSRRDSFYDTFTTTSAEVSVEGRYGDGGFAVGIPITGGVVDEGEPTEKDIPFIPDEKGEIILLLILILIIGAVIFILLKRRRIYYKDFKLPHFRILIGIVISIGLVLLIGNFLYRIIKNLATYSIGQDPLFRNIIFIGFIVGMIILLFKTLNIRGEIRFGEDIQSKRYQDDKKTSKLQHKINQEILKVELAQAKKEKRVV